MAKVSEYKGTIISTVTGLSGHKVRLTVSQSNSTSGATGTTTLTWRLYYELSRAASIQTGSNRSTTFKLAGKTITSNWNLNNVYYSGPGYVELGTGTITINRTLSNANAYDITGQITSTHILTGTNSWSSGKGPGTTNSYTINKVTLATNITGPTSFTVDESRIAFKTSTSTTFSWSGQASGTNNTIGMILQYKWRNADWADWLSLSESSKTITWGSGGDWTDFNEGEVIQFRIKSVGGTLKDTQYTSTIEVKINNVPTLNPIVVDNNYISSEKKTTEKEFRFNANDLNGDILTYQYKQDDDDWVDTESSFILEFNNENNHTIFFKVSDGYDSEEKEIELILSEPLTLNPILSFETPDINNSKLTKLLTTANAYVEGGVAPYTYEWTLINGDQKFNKTDSVFSQEFLPNGSEIKYSLTVTDFFKVKKTIGEISTGYFTPSIPSISELLISKDNTFGGVDGFYNGFKYNYTIGEGNTFATIDKYDFIVYRKDGEENIELKATHNEANQVFNFESRGTNEHFLKLTITDAFGQAAELDSNSLNRLYHLNELFTTTNLISQNPNVYKPLSMKESSYDITYPAVFNSMAMEQFFNNNPFNLQVSVQATYGEEEWKLENLFNEIEILTEGFRINLGSFDNFIFTKDINSRELINYVITFSNNFETLTINQNNKYYVDFREPPTINNIFTGWQLNEITDTIQNGIYYLSYNDTLTIPIDEQISDLNGKKDIVSRNLEVFSSNTKISGNSSYKDGNLIWINKNREITFEDIDFQVTITDSTGYSVKSSIKCGDTKFHACRSTYPKMRVNTVGGETDITFTVEDYGDDETYKNYRCYYKGQTLKSDSALFEGLIYRGHEGYNKEKSIKFSFTIEDITDNYDPNSTPNILYCTYDPVMNLASGIKHTNIPDLTWVWFGEAPTISPRKNRLGINVKAEGMGGDSLIEVHMANKEKKCVKFIGIASQNGKPHEIVLDLSEGKISGAVLENTIISGGTWDKLPVTPEPEVPETEEV